METRFKSFREFADALVERVIGTACERCGETLERGDEIAVEYGPALAPRGTHRRCRPPETEIPFSLT